MIFTRKSGLQIKNPDGSGDWVTVTHPYVKIPSYTYTVYTTVPPTTVDLTSSSGTFVVPDGVTSLTINMIGAGGNGNANEGSSNPGPGGGSGAYFANYVLSVTPGQNIPYSVGRPGQIFIPSGDGGQTCGGDTVFGSLTAGGGFGGKWRSGPYGDEGPGAGGVASAGGTNGTAGNAGGGSGGKGADSPFGIGGDGRYGSGYGGDIKNGGNATGYGAGGGGGGNNAGGGSGSPGKLSVYYSSPTSASLVTTGGWKEIQQTYVKVDGSWKPVSQQNAITLYNYK
jgi:hypothetical protein